VETAKIVCMQCGRVIRDFRLESGLVSHGICVDCAAEFARLIEELDLGDARSVAWAASPALAAGP
jgi:DNA-directed RNA polymerase subunit RPC12/RpoP